MSKSATEVMQEAIFAAVLDAVEALKKASKGLPNNLVRDLGALHVNTGFADTPAELQAAVQASVRTTFSRLQREGYAVSDAAAARQAPRPNPTIVPRGSRGPARDGQRPAPGTRPAGNRPDDRPRGPRPPKR